MKQRIFALILLLSVLFIQGCGYLGAALSAGAAYGISQLFK